MRVDDLFYDEANRHIHAALTALACDDIPEMRAELARAVLVGDRWEQAMQEEANRTLTRSTGDDR